MPTTSQWIAFLGASILFIQVPGPSLLFTIGRALSVGRRDALVSVLGNAMGLMVQVVGVAFGLAALLATSATAFTVLKLVGAAYVIWLGIRTIRHRADARIALIGGEVVGSQTVWSSLRTGILVGLTNPKTIVFFGAFLPQFVNTEAGHPGIQIMALGVAFGITAALSDSIWALAASKARDWFARKPTRLDRLGIAGGVMMIGLGGVLAASE